MPNIADALSISGGTFRFGAIQVFVLLPTEAIALQSPDEVSGYTTGGTGATINYSLLHNINKYNGDNDNYTSAALQSGINMGDWIIRNSTSVALSNGDHNLDNLYTYAEHTFTASKINMQAGGINLANPLLSGASLYGVQIQPDISLTPNRRNDVMVSGNVKSSQARIEIRQNKQLIYSTLAPMGPFTLTNVPVLNQSSNLDVTVIESDGSSDQFTVFSDSFRRTVTGTPNYNFAVGRVREVGAEDDEPMVLSGAWSQPVLILILYRQAASSQITIMLLLAGLIFSLSLTGQLLFSSEVRSMIIIISEGIRQRSR